MYIFLICRFILLVHRRQCNGSIVEKFFWVKKLILKKEIKHVYDIRYERYSGNRLIAWMHIEATKKISEQRMCATGFQ